jgi:hypothetical protein
MDEIAFSISLNVNENTHAMTLKGVEAERGGLNQVWIGDLPSQRYPAIIAGQLAKNTHKIRIGLGPISPLIFPAEHIASMLITLSEIYGQRFDVCLVPGDRNSLKKIGRKYDDILSRMVESLKIIRKKLQKRDLHAKIWLGAQGPKMIRASLKFDGVLINLSSPEMVKVTLNNLHVNQYMKTNFKIGLFFPSYIYQEYDPKIHQKAEKAAAQIISGASKTLLKQLNLNHILQQIPSSSKELDLNEQYQHIPKEILKQFHVSRHIHNLHEYIEKLEEIGVSHFVFSFPQNYSIKLIRNLSYATNLMRHSSI